MGAIGGLVGLGGGANGTGFANPTGAGGQGTQPTVNPTSSAQIGSAYTDNQAALGSQQALLTALQGQNGIGNQSSVYGQQQGLANQLGNAGGVQAQQGALQGFQNIANGTGPNVAQSMLNQTTGQNVANQSALMAGQRGSAQNVGLMARQAAQQGAATQQQAAGQAATLQAQQQQAALGQMAGIGQGLTSAQQAQQGQLAGMANTQAGQQIGATSANTAAQQAEQANLINAQTSFNNAQVGMQGNINSSNAALANTQMQGQQALIGGILNGAGSAMGARGGQVQKFDDGGDVQDFGGSGVEVSQIPSMPGPQMSTDAGAAALGGKSGGGGGGGGGGGMSSMLPMLAACMADGGDVNQQPSLGATPPAAAMPNMPPAQTDPSIPQSSFGKFLQGFGGKKVKASGSPAQSQGQQQSDSGAAALANGMSNFIGGAGKMLTPTSGASDAASDVSTDGMAHGGMTHDYRAGGKVNAKNIKEKAKVPGNSYSNDTIPAVLSEHEIVLPRSVTLSKDPVRASADFVAKVIAKRKKK